MLKEFSKMLKYVKNNYKNTKHFCSLTKTVIYITTNSESKTQQFSVEKVSPKHCVVCIIYNKLISISYNLDNITLNCSISI